jgi:peroxiredoxin
VTKNLLRCVLSLGMVPAAWCGAPQFELRDTVGGVHTGAEWARSRAVVLFFVATDCPIANSYVPEMKRLHGAYAQRGVLFLAVQAEPRTARAEVARYARDYRYAFPMLLDPRQFLVHLTGATVTPQAAVLSPAGSLLYLGRIDNRAADFGVQRPRATALDLREALDAVLAGKPVPHPFTKSIGCAIPRVK